MRLLLTSAGIKNTSIHDALLDLLGKPIAESQRPLHSHRGVRAPDGRSQRGASVRECPLKKGRWICPEPMSFRWPARLYRVRIRKRPERPRLQQRIREAA